MKTYVVSTHNICFCQVVSTHIICFCQEIRKYRYFLIKKSALSRAMCTHTPSLVRQAKHYWIYAQDNILNGCGSDIKIQTTMTILRHLIYGLCQAKKSLWTCAKFAESDHPTLMQSIIQAFAHSYILKYPMILLVDTEGPDQTVPCRLIWAFTIHIMLDTLSQGATHIITRCNCLPNFARLGQLYRNYSHHNVSQGPIYRSK